MPLYSRQDLADHCLRTLGAPVLSIEIDNDQLSDAIETAVNFYHDYHTDGIERDYVKHKIVFTTVTLSDASLVNVRDVLVDGAENAVVMSKNGNVLTMSRNQGPGSWTVGHVASFPAGTATITAVVLGD